MCQKADQGTLDRGTMDQETLTDHTYGHAVPLSMMKPGQRLRVMGIAAGRCANRRLSDLGLIPDTEIEIVQKQGNGPLILAVRDTRIAIGHGVAHKVLVQLVTQQQLQDSPQCSTTIPSKKNLFSIILGNGSVKKDLPAPPEQEVSPWIV